MAQQRRACHCAVLSPITESAIVGEIDNIIQLDTDMYLIHDTSSAAPPGPPAPPGEPPPEPEHEWTEEEIDEAIEESFPASDPPGFQKID